MLIVIDLLINAIALLLGWFVFVNILHIPMNAIAYFSAGGVAWIFLNFLKRK